MRKGQRVECNLHLLTVGERRKRQEADEEMAGLNACPADHHRSRSAEYGHHAEGNRCGAITGYQAEDADDKREDTDGRNTHRSNLAVVVK
ncbi:hypothetical protein D3C87_1811640 [compost metagenome]